MVKRTTKWYSHPPCEDVSWKKQLETKAIQMGASSSLWGCELKNRRRAFRFVRKSHPPCEDVSWKGFTQPVIIDKNSHPPCEDVSWKNEIKRYGWCCIVILLVRMWVEKYMGRVNKTSCPVILLVRMWVEKCKTCCYRAPVKSSSLWGCELKRYYYIDRNCVLLSSSLWGCELKRLEQRWNRWPYCHPPCEDVSWKAEE